MDYFVATHGLAVQDEEPMWDMHACFDGGTLEFGLFVDKSTDILDGATFGTEEIAIGDEAKLVKEAILLTVRSNTQSDFRFPLCVFGVENMTLPVFKPKLKKAVRSIARFLSSHKVIFII